MAAMAIIFYMMARTRVARSEVFFNLVIFMRVKLKAKFVCYTKY